MLAVVVSLVAAGCGSHPGRPAPAATVGNQEISRSQVEAQLKIDQAVEKFVSKLQGGTKDDIAKITESYTGQGSGTLPTSKAAESLTKLVRIAALESALETRGGKVTPKDRTDARQGVESDLTSQGVDVKKLPKAFLDQQVDGGALQVALARTVKITPAQLQAEYKKQSTSYEQICVTVIAVKTKAAAQAALDRVNAGEDISAVSAEVSEDAQTKQAGGVFPCQAPSTLAQQIDPDLATALVGQALGPTEVPSASLWVVSKITKRTTKPLSEVKTEIEQRLQAAKLPTFYEAELKHVKVDPRYGTWDRKKAAVVPPGTPTSTTKKATTTTTAAGN